MISFIILRIWRWGSLKTLTVFRVKVADALDLGKIKYRNFSGWHSATKKFNILKLCGYGGMADALDLGSSPKGCRFNSCYPHQKNRIYWIRFFILFVSLNLQLFVCPLVKDYWSLCENNYSRNKNLDFKIENGIVFTVNETARENNPFDEDDDYNTETYKFFNDNEI